jgi:hypothetical protein
LEPVTELYYGYARDIYPDLDTTEHWHENLLLRLQQDKERFHMEEREPDCANEVPFEGLVIRKESLSICAFKLKTKWHALWASKKQDDGAVDLEEQEEQRGDE